MWLETAVIWFQAASYVLTLVAISWWILKRISG